jgi:hypothetical protein
VGDVGAHFVLTGRSAAYLPQDRLVRFAIDAFATGITLRQVPLHFGRLDAGQLTDSVSPKLVVTTMIVRHRFLHNVHGYWRREITSARVIHPVDSDSRNAPVNWQPFTASHGERRRLGERNIRRQEDYATGKHCVLPIFLSQRFSCRTSRPSDTVPISSHFNNQQSTIASIRRLSSPRDAGAVNGYRFSCFEFRISIMPAWCAQVAA